MVKDDIRLDTDFVNHPKTKRVIRELGFEGFYSLVCLFSTVAKLYNKGNLKTCDKFDIADMANWKGEPEKFVNVLLNEKSKYLDQVNGEYSIHDWKEHQSWVFHADERSERARQAANTRWNPTSGNDAGSMQDAYNEHTSSNAPTPIPSPVPSPEPSPSQNMNAPASHEALCSYAQKTQSSEFSAFLQLYDELYRQYFKKEHKKVKNEQFEEAREVLERNDVFSMDKSTQEEMIQDFFENVKSNDYSLLHFATDGILELRNKRAM
jgi:hypothetical protein